MVFFREGLAIRGFEVPGVHPAFRIRLLQHVFFPEGLAIRGFEVPGVHPAFRIRL